MEQITLKKNLTSGIVGLLFGAMIWFAIPYCIRAKFTIFSTGIGPDYLPKLIAVIMMLCGIGLIVQSLVFKKDETVTIEFQHESRSLLFIVALIGYVLLLPVIGFVVASCLFAAASLFLMECRKLLYYLYAALLVATIFVAFKYGLSVPLPSLFL